MQVMIMVLTWLLIILLLAATGALICRCFAWGAAGWLEHRLQAERVRAARLQAQAQIETARARERAAVATAEARAQAEVMVAQVKAQAQVAIGEMQARGASYPLPAREQDDLRGDKPVARPLIAAPVPVNPVGSPLPELVHWRHVAHTVRPGYFAYGVAGDGQLVQKPVTSAYHTLLHGETRSGKTTGIHSLVVQAHRLARVTAVRLYMTDVKRELGAVWGRSPILAAPVQNDATSAGHLITELVQGTDGVLARYREFERLAHAEGVICASIRDYERHHPEGVRGRPALVFVVIDELNALLELARRTDELQRSLTILLQTGAGAGYYVIAGAQYLNAKVLGRDATQQFVSRAHFGTPDPIALRMLFGQSPPQTDATAVPPGRGYIRVQGQVTALPFQGIYCDEQTILDVQTEIRNAHVTTPVARQISEPISFADYRARALVPAREHVVPLEEKREISAALPATYRAAETSSMAFQSDFSTSSLVTIDPEKASKVAQVLVETGGKKKPSKTAIIAEVWGVTGGRRYTEASLEYEAIVASLSPGIASGVA